MDFISPYYRVNINKMLTKQEKEKLLLRVFVINRFMIFIYKIIIVVSDNRTTYNIDYTNLLLNVLYVTQARIYSLEYII